MVAELLRDGGVVHERAMIDQAVLHQQYAGLERLAARQSLWALRAGPALHTTVLDRAGLTGSETVLDVGCGSGIYLAELRRRGHTGMIVGLDRSAGMARNAKVHAATVVADAQFLPLGDDSVDVALCLHMLYHVPDLVRAVAELRRVLRPGGVAMVTTNAAGHTIEARQLLATAADQVAALDVGLDLDTRRFDPTVARALFGAAFTHLDVHEMSDSLQIENPAILLAYIASWPPESIGLSAGPLWDQVLTATSDLITAHFASHQAFTISSRVVMLRCQ
jgi:SAM-dependent methyltransferase